MSSQLTSAADYSWQKMKQATVLATEEVSKFTHQFSDHSSDHANNNNSSSDNHTTDDNVETGKPMNV